MDLAQRLTPRVALQFGCAVWPLVFTHRVLLECEELTGLPTLAGVSLSSAKLIRALLYAALKRASAPYSLKQVGDRITPENRFRVHQAVHQAWAAAMPEPESDEPEPAPERAKPLTWIEAWAIARYDLHLTADEWLDMTPRMAHELRLRQIHRWQREELMTGIIASTSANFSMRGPKRPLTAEQFMLHPPKKEPEAPMTGEQIMAVFAAFRK